MSKFSLKSDWNVFSEYLTYDENVESCLKLIKPWSTHFNFKQKVSESVGLKQYMRDNVPHGYRFRFKGYNYMVHRVIWSLTHQGLDDNLVIDHLDGNPFNNNIKNLRAVPPEINARNAKLRCDNKTGHAGIRIVFNGLRSYYVQASYKKDGTLVSKRWSLSEFEYENALIEALKWREKEINNPNNGYTSRHGKLHQ